MKKCNTCSSIVRADANFCPRCGSGNLTQLKNRGNGRIGSIVKAVLCVVAFFAAQIAVTVVFATVESIRLSIGKTLSADELEALVLESVSRNTVLLGIISNIAVIAIFALYFLIKRKNVCHELGLRKFPPVLAPICAVFGYAMQYAIITFISLIPWPPVWLTQHGESTSAIMSGSLILVVLGTSIITGFAEETVFRVLMINRLGRAYSGILCVAISAALFGLAHVSPIAVVYATILGLVFGCIYRRYRSVWPCAIAHMSFNLASIIGLPNSSLLFFAVSAVSIGVCIISMYLIFYHIEITEE